MNRRKQGLDDSNVKKVTLNDEPIHVDNDKSIVNGTDNRLTLQDRVDYSKYRKSNSKIILYRHANIVYFIVRKVLVFTVLHFFRMYVVFCCIFFAHASHL